MLQEKKDEPIYSLPGLINGLFEDREAFSKVFECLKSLRGQFYEGYATDLLNLIKDHTKNVKSTFQLFSSVIITISFH